MSPIGIIFIVIGAVFILVGVITFGSYLYYNKKAVATATDIIHKETGIELYDTPMLVAKVEYTFVTEDGETIVVEYSPRNVSAVGDTTIVRYNKRNPHKIFIKPEGDDGSIKMGIILIVAGVGIIALGIVIALGII